MIGTQREVYETGRTRTYVRKFSPLELTHNLRQFKTVEEAAAHLKRPVGAYSVEITEEEVCVDQERGLGSVRATSWRKISERVL